MIRQFGLPFDWAQPAPQMPFLAGEANAQALQHIENWRQWPIPISILTGPARSGKSALGRYFAGLSGGTVIDDADAQADEILFHQWNIARDRHFPLLMIAQPPPGSWPVTLPDLKSRIAAAPHVRIAEPDDGLVLALIENGLGQAGSAYSPDLPDWLARRVERSYAGVSMLLERLNAVSLASARKISVPVAKEALQNCHFFHIEGDVSAQDGAHQQGRKSSDDV